VGQFQAYKAALPKPRIAEDFKRAATLRAVWQERPGKGEGFLCLMHLYSALIGASQSGNQRTLGQLTAEAIRKHDTTINKRLGMWGIRFEPGNVYQWTPAALIVANHHTGLDRLFAGTRWAGGGWRQALALLGCTPSKTKRFGGMNSRGLIVPQEHWPEQMESSAVALRSRHHHRNIRNHAAIPSDTREGEASPPAQPPLAFLARIMEENRA
jgi:hypothetical protein